MTLWTAPFRAFLFIAGEIAERAEETLYGEEALHNALVALNSEYESGSIGRDEFDRREALLLDRLREGDRRKRRRQRENDR